MNLTFKTLHQLQVFFALIIIAILNASLFADLDLVHHTPFTSTVYWSFFTFGIYFIFLSIAGVYIFLQKRRQALRTFHILLTIMTGHIFFNLYYLIVNKKINDNGLTILFDAMIIWAVTILVFAIWYWTIDNGGPFTRRNPDGKHRCDLLFPQQQSQIQGWQSWQPDFLDYLFFSFFIGTGFSPADILPLTKRIKLLVMIEALISLTIIGMIVTRAVGLL